MATDEAFPSSRLSLSGLSSSASESASKLWSFPHTALSKDNLLTVYDIFYGADRSCSAKLGTTVLLLTILTMILRGMNSPLLQDRSRKRLMPMGRRHRSAPNGHSDVPAGTVTSSEDEYYENEDSEDKRGNNLGRRRVQREEPSNDEAISTDPGLLRKHSSYESYTTSVATYPSVRTFYCPHPHMSKLPSTPAPIPLLVFVHGLGGSLAQFQHVLTGLCNLGPCFGIDLPGCGLSTFAPKSWDAYTVEALAELLTAAIERHRDREAGQGVILVAHSLGCSLSALVASSTSPIKCEDLKKHILGLIAVCPRATPPSPEEATVFRRLLRIPTPIFNLWRCWDRRGGPQSASVTRFVGADADLYTRELQVRFNRQSRTPVWRRMAWGSLPEYVNGKAVGGMPGEEVWAGVQTAILLVAGESDAITRPAEVQKLLEVFGETKIDTDLDNDNGSIIPDASEIHDRVLPKDTHNIKTGSVQLKMDEEKSSEKSHVERKRIIKTSILPPPASHALLFDRATYHTLSGIMQEFLSQQVDSRLNLGWQLQYLNTSGKWDVKNLVKWKKVVPVSQPVGETFAALKVLREVDDSHNPVTFSQRYRGKIHAVVDISHENPVYDPAELERNGVRYFKHPTVSKLPPTPDETRDFIALVDRIQNDITVLMEAQGNHNGKRPLVGVHCHYGYNRTGFLIACYLVERRGFSVHDAIEEFERRRPPGIRHRHFIDTLFMRYCVGLKA